jgi:hypothetical protein
MGTILGYHSDRVYWVLGLVQRPVFYRTQRFGNWILFRAQVRGWETSSLLGPLGRANLSHWTCIVDNFTPTSDL